MRILAFIVLLVGAASAGGAVFYAKQFFDAQAVSLSSQSETVRLLAAKQALETGDVLAPENLQWVEVPRALVPVGAFSSPEQLLGEAKGDRRWVLKWIGEGELVLQGKVTELNQPARLIDNLPPHMRAKSFGIDAVTGVSGFIAPGDRVDIMYTHTVDGQLASSILLQAVLILAIDQVKDNETTSPRVARTVTVAVTPEDAQRIELARQSGSLSLLLRGGDAELSEPVRPLLREDLDGEKPAPEERGPGVWKRLPDGTRIWVPFG